MPDDPKRPTPVGVPRLRERASSQPHHDHSIRRKSDTDLDATPVVKIDDDYTDRHEGEELRSLRATRPMSVRIARLEDKHDELSKKVDDRHAEMNRHIDGMRSDMNKVQVAVADMGGQFKVIPQLVSSLQDATTALRERDHVTLTAKVEVEKAHELDAVDARKSAREESVDAKKTARRWVTEAIAIVAGIVATVSTAIAAGQCGN